MEGIRLTCYMQRPVLNRRARSQILRDLPVLPFCTEPAIFDVDDRAADELIRS